MPCKTHALSHTHTHTHTWSLKKSTLSLVPGRLKDALFLSVDVTLRRFFSFLPSLMSLKNAFLSRIWIWSGRLWSSAERLCFKTNSCSAFCEARHKHTHTRSCLHQTVKALSLFLLEGFVFIPYWGDLCVRACVSADVGCSELWTGSPTERSTLRRNPPLADSVGDKQPSVISSAFLVAPPVLHLPRLITNT